MSSAKYYTRRTQIITCKNTHLFNHNIHPARAVDKNQSLLRYWFGVEYFSHSLQRQSSRGNVKGAVDRSSTDASRRRHGPSLCQRSDARCYQQISFVDRCMCVSRSEVTFDIGSGETSGTRSPPLGRLGRGRCLYDVRCGGRAEHALEGSTVLSVQGLHYCHGGFHMRVVLQEGVEFVQYYGPEAGYFQLAALVARPADDQLCDPTRGLAKSSFPLQALMSDTMGAGCCYVVFISVTAYSP